MASAIAHDIENGEQRTSDVAASSTSFKELHLSGGLLKCLQSHKFLTPTKIQAAAIPMALAGMDLLVQSKSGTGKTLIYVLTAIETMIRSIPKPQALIIVPTRELAIQVEDTINGLAKKMRDNRHFLAVSFIGGTDVNKDRIRMAKGRVVVGTPGRLLHLIHNKVFDTSSIKLLVLDEADQLCATSTLHKDVESLIQALQPRKQIIACSATYPNKLDECLAQLMVKPVLVSNSERATVLLGIRQFVYELPEQPNSMVEMLAKLAALHKIFAQLPYEQAILFASSQSRADSFCNYLQRDGIECDLMSGAMKQSKRLETFQAYRNYKMRTIVATDLMARGVDSSHANLVINLDPPRDLVTYLHRIGRAGRFGSKGIAITFISSPQQCQQFKGIIAEAGTGMSVLQFPTEKREGFDFWKYDSYDFPYFQETAAHEQEEGELKRLKQRWKEPGADMPKHTDVTSDNLNANDSKEPEAVQETTVAAANQLISPESQLAPEVEANNNETEVEETDNKENLSENQAQIQINKNTVLGEQSKQLVKPPEVHELLLERVELSTSIDLPAAAPNSINTRTYCLAAPATERSSTTLHPQAISNTVDDASSIVSDSMENDYDSDSSYTTFYSDSDARLIWRSAMSQQKLQKRRNYRAKRPTCISKVGYCVKIIKYYNSAEDRIQTKKKLSKRNEELLSPEVQEDEKEQKRNINRLLAKVYRNAEFMYLLKKFKNMPQVQAHLMDHFKQANFDMQEYKQLIHQLNIALKRLYCVDPNKPKSLPKLPMPGKPHLANKLMTAIKGSAGPGEQQPGDDNDDDDDDADDDDNQPQQPLNRLSVHVNHQLNIPPANAVRNEDAYSLNSEDSMSDDSVEPAYSSSGFVESNESASSGIDTSQYGSNSSVFLDTDEYDDGEEEEEVDSEEEESYSEESEDENDEDNEGDELSNSSSTLTAMTSSSEESSSSDESESETQESDEGAAGYDAAADLAAAQDRWQNLFNMQYQFIAHYVNTYTATYRRNQ